MPAISGALSCSLRFFLPHRCNLIALRNVDPGSTAGIGIRVELDRVVGRRHAGCAPNAAVVLVPAGEPRTLWRNRVFPVAVPMLLFFALFVTIFARVSAWERDQSLLEFRLVSRQSADKIERARSLIRAAERGSERGARLTKSLLAFSRRQVLRPEVADATRIGKLLIKPLRAQQIEVELRELLA
jgi:hypothetical protein